jgi:hypothetical protein
VAISPVVLRIAEDVASHAMSRVIEADEEENPSLWRRLAFDGLSGLGLGAVIGLVAFGVIDLGLGSAPGTSAFGLSVAATLGVSVLVVTLIGTLVGRIAERRAMAGRRVSQTGVAVTLMAVGAVSVVSLLVVAAIISARIGA